MQRALLSAVCVVGLFSHGGSHVGDTRTVDVIRSYGYDAEELRVTTEDGYSLALTHIKSVGTKLPVLMMHGVLSASDQWVLRGPKQDLALILADNGYDVWLGDMRGNVFSKNHSYMNPSEPDFWNFSFHESGLYDVPALINSVLQKTGKKQLFYVGHSMGSSVFYVMGALRPEYNSQIRLAVHLAPVAFGRNKSLSFVLQQLLTNAENIAEELKKQKMYEFVVRTPVMHQMVEDICTDQNKFWCLFLVSQLFGPETQIQNMTKLQTYLKSMSGTSVKTMLHLSQIFKSTSKTFSMFDYGAEKNVEIYRSKDPPEYPLERVTSPIALYYSDKDSFVDESTVDRLSKQLPNVVITASIPGYNHIDLLWADNADKLLYKRIVKILNKS